MAESRVALVTGAGGFIGEQLIRHLSKTSRTVVGTYRQRKIEYPSVAMIQADLEDPHQVNALLRQARPTEIHHLAAMSDVAQCEQNPADARRAIVDATRNIVEAARRIEPSARIVFVSTDQVYAGMPPDPKRGYTEEDPAEPLSVYGKLKREAEEIVLEVGGTVIRSALVYGPPSTHHPGILTSMVRALRAGKTLSLFEDEIRTPVHVDDLCQACDVLTSETTIGIWNVGGSERLNRVEMGQVVCDCFGLDRALLQRTCLAESTYPAPRPADVALCIDKYAALPGQAPRGFSTGVRGLSVAGIA